MIVVVDGNKIYYYHFDGLGSVVALSNNDGEIEISYTYDAFGYPYSSEGGFPQEYRFTGRKYDSETGNYYYRARYYNPRIGRFLQPDPIRYASGLNLYTYVGNNPVNWVDPWGLKRNIFGDIIGGTGNLIGGAVNVVGTGAYLVVSDIGTHLGPPSFYVQGQGGIVLPVKVFKSRSNQYGIPGISGVSMNPGGVIHTSPEIADALKKSQNDRGGEKYSEPVKDDASSYGTDEEQHMAHELGHQVDADKWGIFYPFLGFLMTQNPNSTFEQNASSRGEYYGIEY